jgi:maltose O-acetyltransferase
MLLHWLSDIKAFLQYGDLPTSFYVKRGMKVGKNFNRQTGTRLDPSNCWLIEIGDDVIIGNKVQLIAHDFSIMHHTGYARFGRIVIGDRVFIGANSTILMNVHVGNDVVIGAGSLVNKDVPEGSVVAGVPAKVICSTAEYVKRQQELLARAPKFLKSDTTYGGGGKTKQQKILRALEQSHDGVFYAKFRDFRRLIGSGDTEKI